jgi:hypothetical protein
MLLPSPKPVGMHIVTKLGSGGLKKPGFGGNSVSGAPAVWQYLQPTPDAQYRVHTTHSTASSGRRDDLRALAELKVDDMG